MYSQMFGSFLPIVCLIDCFIRTSLNFQQNVCFFSWNASVSPNIEQQSQLNSTCNQSQLHFPAFWIQFTNVVFNIISMTTSVINKIDKKETTKLQLLQYTTCDISIIMLQLHSRLMFEITRNTLKVNVKEAII